MDEEKNTMPEGMRFKDPALATDNTETETPKADNTETETPKADNYEELENYIRRQVDAIKRNQETEEQRKKRERREKTSKFLAGIADGLGSFHTAFSHARGEQAMQMPNLSEKMQQRYDKLKAQNEHDEDRRMNYLLQLQQLRNQRFDTAYKTRMLALREQGEDRRQLQADIADRKLEWQRKYQQGILDIQKEKLEIERQYKQGLITEREKDAAKRTLEDYEIETSYERDALGNVTKKTTTRTVQHNDGSTTTTTSDNTPPSRQQGSNNDNTAPSLQKKDN